MINKIGYACVNMTLSEKTTHSLRANDYSELIFENVVSTNLTALKKILAYNVNVGLKFFRISSNIIPLATHAIQTFDWKATFKNTLHEIGDYITENNIRISMHPGQYCVLNSTDSNVVKNAISDLIYHCEFLDALGIDYSHKIVIHVGGVYGDKVESSKRFISNFQLLPQNVKKRLILENDDKSYTFEEVYLISQSCFIPIVFDYFHYLCNNVGALEFEKIITLVKNSWQFEDGVPIYHYSEQDASKKNGAHDKMITYEAFMTFFNLFEDKPGDIMIESKSKNIAAIKALNCIKYYYGTTLQSDLINEWSHYKYPIMAYGYQYYTHIKNMVKSGCNIAEFYLIVEKIMTFEKTDRGQANTAEHVWGYVKNYASTREKNHFFKQLDAKKWSSITGYLYKLCLKYSADYVLNSYYFIL